MTFSPFFNHPIIYSKNEFQTIKCKKKNITKHQQISEILKISRISSVMKQLHQEFCQNHNMSPLAISLAIHMCGSSSQSIRNIAHIYEPHENFTTTFAQLEISLFLFIMEICLLMVLLFLNGEKNIPIVIRCARNPEYHGNHEKPRALCEIWFCENFLPKKKMLCMKKHITQIMCKTLLKAK